MMKLLALVLALSFCMSSYAQEGQSGVDSAASDATFKLAAANFASGKYQSTVENLINIEANLKKQKNPDKNKLGLAAYWKGVCFNRLQNFPEAIKNFDQALQYNYSPLDLNYEYGQALFAADKMSEARLQFTESVKKKFKRGVSLYYIAFISKELGETKMAVTFYKAIQKLDAEEAKEVRQASEVQIGDIYLDQVEKHPDAFKAVEHYVIPQYQLALEIDKTSSIAPSIKEKIITLQRKYDLVMFKLRNGRPTLIPPYFMRASNENGYDSNVIFSPTENQLSESKTGSTFSKIDVMGRYTFYFKDIMSIAPEVRLNRTRYWNRDDDIKRNDNGLVAPALRTAHEHTIWKKPASFLLDYDYNDARRDINSTDELEFSSRSHTLMVGERFNYFNVGESIFRVRRRLFESYQSSNDSNTTSVVFEQIQSMGGNTMLYMVDYSMSRVDSDTFDTNSLTLRSDLIMARVRDWFTPSFGLGLTFNKAINDSARGTEFKYAPSFRAAKTFKGNWRGNFKFEYEKNKSDDDAFIYKKHLTSIEIEYVF